MPILHGDRNGGGHLHTATKKGKTRFPRWWSAEDVLEAIVDAQFQSQATKEEDGSIKFERFSRGKLLRISIRDGKVGTKYPVKGNGVEDYFPVGNVKNHC